MQKAAAACCCWLLLVVAVEGEVGNNTKMPLDVCAFQNEIRTCIKTENMKFMQIAIPSSAERAEQNE
jgi:hypothetical protein